MISPNLDKFKQTITGRAVLGDNLLEISKQESDSSLDQPDKVEKSLINSQIDMVVEEFSLPINELDVIIKAKQVDILTHTADISLTLDGPMEMQAFNGKLQWENSMLTLSGQLDKHLSEQVEINWKAQDDVEIRVIKGTVKVSQLSISSFESIVSGQINIGEKVTQNALGPNVRTVRPDYAQEATLPIGPWLISLAFLTHKS
ncbi:MAG: hypothetical protein MAG795_00953 [Candidatus Woesearchaeota archaeon]|nr:hypothetical protein [Candidatus Woesearchaeota archaeon]